MEKIVVADFKAMIDELVAIIKKMIEDMIWFINGFKQKDSFDAE